MSIQLLKAYKIIPPKHKRYGNHYQIPAERTLVVPLRWIGDEVSCDVRWEDDNGELKILQNVIFIRDNLMECDGFTDIKLLELWQHYYPQPEN